ncbi:DNA polymerase III, delta subunit [Lachnospiraceae bacterium 2_1_46FAA]|nr:DNA polymerase III, delta subunit [Lachnospiraceae bacterium 2_1_46FAA]
MKSLNEDLKTGNFKRVYLLFGEENYLKKQYKDRLTKALISEGDTMNYAYYEGKGIDVKEIIDLSETMPFFSERRLIVIENSGFFKNATAELAEYMKEIPETTYFIFVETELDKRGKMFKAVKDKGRIVELARQDEKTLVRWIYGNVKKEGKQIAESTIYYLLSKCGTDMENLQKEMEKLFCYTLNNDVINMEDIDAICTMQITNEIFDMVNAVAEKKQKRALDRYYDLLALKEPAMRILYLLSRQFRLLMEVKEMAGEGYDKKTIASKAGLHPYAVGKYIEQSRSFSQEELRKILEESVDIEERVKTGRLGDVLAVELFIVKYSSNSV